MSTHENIRHPDEHQYFNLHRDLELQKARLERDFYQRRYEAACDDLRAIHDRVEAGERVYFVREDKSVLALKHDQTEED